MTEAGREVSEVISGPSRDQSGRVDMGSILRSFWVNSEVILDPFLGNLIEYLNLPSFGRG